MSVSVSVKKNFPIFKQYPNLVFFDNASTTQKPHCVIDAEMQCYEKNYANVHRGVYDLSEMATQQFEQVRNEVADFIHAKKSSEIIVTKGTTESINLVAHSFGMTFLKPRDEVIVSVMDHHSSIVPWQQVCEKTGAILKVILLNEKDEFNIAAFEKLLTDKTKFVSIIHVSNVLGTINPVEKMIAMAHEQNIPVLLDGAQAVGHFSIDVQKLDCDFYAFSAHKMYGPTGVGILYGKEKYLDKMPPYQTGGNMIQCVTFEKTEFSSLPTKFEAGTPNIAGVAGFAAAMQYVNQIGFENIQTHEKKLLDNTTHQLQKITGLKIFGTSAQKSGVISFAMQGVHPHDVATILNAERVAVRAGHHCAMPLMDYLHVPALTRVSFGIYNDLDDVEKLIVGLNKVREIFG